MCPSFFPLFDKRRNQDRAQDGFCLLSVDDDLRMYVGKPLCLVSFLVFNIAAFYLTLSQHNFGISKICSSPTCCLENFAAITQSKKQCHVHTCMYACHLKKCIKVCCLPTCVPEPTMEYYENNLTQDKLKDTIIFNEFSEMENNLQFF
jgi:hypothetical protein